MLLNLILCLFVCLHVATLAQITTSSLFYSTLQPPTGIKTLQFLKLYLSSDRTSQHGLHLTKIYTYKSKQCIYTIEKMALNFQSDIFYAATTFPQINHVLLSPRRSSSYVWLEAGVLISTVFNISARLVSVFWFYWPGLVHSTAHSNSNNTAP